ncbi:MAG: right-handed parallel beta-helix repeat-containing protein, partial [Phycisphaerae bacterium]|nr:right-handed parallel beta-helix repeat-containing protein [Phycisphaerae bacterium]
MRKLTFLLAWLVLSLPCSAKIIYVDADATGANDGTSWADAYTNLWIALSGAPSETEIRVAEGIYKSFNPLSMSPVSRTDTFQMKNGVTIKGGYAGFGEPDPDARDIRGYETILSGDINGDDVSVSDPYDMRTEPTRAENSFHVVTGSGTDQTAILDGFTITGGQADGSFPRSHGGGIHNFGGSPTVFNCKIDWNYASGGGGGVSSDGEPTFTNCWFYRSSTGGSGGGLYVWSGSATLIGCNFYQNSAGWGGGGLAIQTASATVTTCTFRTNSAGINGGGMCCDGGTYTLTDCIFRDNSAERGGALWNIDCTAGLRDNPVVSDCRFYDNEATDGGGMFNTASTPTVAGCLFSRNLALSFGGGVYNEDGSGAVFEGCVFYDNRADVRGGGMSNHGSSPELTKCTFESNYAGDGGGGMNNTSGSGPKLLDCLFEENTILDGGGGGMYNFGNPALTDCTFIGNTAPYESGGGINNFGSLTLKSCIFIDNSGARGGGIHCIEGSATLSSCLLITNSGSEWAGGLCSNSSTVTLTNCTFAANSSPNGNALGCRSAQNVPSSNVEVSNCILWDGGNEIWNEDSSTITITYSDIQGGWSGEGNIDVDPCFASVGYRGGDGVWIDGDYHLLPDSACINAGDPGYAAGPNETDLDGNQRVSGGRIDMGVYELQPLRIVYVDADATGNNDGSSWEDAYNLLQDALAAAYFGDKIWVAQGVYKPDAGGGNTSGDREATFQLIDGVTIKGGYAGFGEPDPNARDVDVYKTILSGDLGGDDGPDFANNSENSRHVVTGNGTITAILDGFTVTGGNANGPSSYNYSGGGFYNQSGRATILNCTFIGNRARDAGGGMYNNNSTPMLTNCTFTCNMACDGGGMYNYDSNSTLINCTFSDNIALAEEGSFGGGMYNSYSNPVLTNCIFTRNMADVGIPDHGGGDGGGIQNVYSNPTLTNCVFSENKALCNGAGISNRSSSPTLNNCIFTVNLAIGHGSSWGDGGGIYNESSKPILNNCTFSGNSASRRGGGIFNNYWSRTTLTNCIFWGDTALQGGDEIALWTYSSGAASSITVSYSDVEGGAAGVYMTDGCILNWEAGNVDVDPCFVEPGYWDADGVWVDGDYHLLEDSVCINAGDPNYVAGPDETDLDGKARVNCGRIDMGAYEFHCPKIVYVDADAMGNNDGSSWIDAYNLLQDALANACE